MLSIDAWLDERPYKELYDGVVHEKVSPQFNHSKIVFQIEKALEAWATGRGEFAAEWRIYPAEGVTLVPDVAFFSHERLAQISKEELQKPPLGPDIVFEVRSPEDRIGSIRRKPNCICNWARSSSLMSIPTGAACVSPITAAMWNSMNPQQSSMSSSMV
jgi:Uma2 family endonuclease